jgi:hypothetical protein
MEVLSIMVLQLQHCTLSRNDDIDLVTTFECATYYFIILTFLFVEIYVEGKTTRDLKYRHKKYRTVWLRKCKQSLASTYFSNDSW